jgi:uncharacterized membrane protein SpoIIM required for sporulation
LTPLEFEATHESGWAELEALLRETPRELNAERFLVLYRMSCEQLALAQARDFPEHIVARLSRITSAAHQIIYRQSEFGLRRIRAALLLRFPAMVRAQRAYVAAAAALFLLPALAMGLATYFQPDLILSLVDQGTASQYENMYNPKAESIGRMRDAGSDWAMFGFYIENNIGIAFQCYVTGVLLGLGSIFFLASNGVTIGAVAGYITARGFGGTFFPFVATHSAFELTAIVLSGAAGMRIGCAVLMPGRLPRLLALQTAARETSFIMFGAAAMLLIAAVLEAFWSSAAWVSPTAKYTCAAVCWALVVLFFLRRPHAD